MVSHAHLITAVLAYLAGSIPFGLLLTQAAGVGDIRQIGSGNTGATNVLRTGRKGLAAFTLLLDAGKGVLAVLFAATYGADLALVAGLMAVIGHNFPLWLKFKGGKGVATTLGVLLAIAWPVGLACIATWIIFAAVFRYSSLAAIAAFAGAPIYSLIWSDGSVTVVTVLLAALGIARHHANIRRLYQGKESKIGRKQTGAGSN